MAARCRRYCVTDSTTMRRARDTSDQVQLRVGDKRLFQGPRTAVKCGVAFCSATNPDSIRTLYTATDKVQGFLHECICHSRPVKACDIDKLNLARYQSRQNCICFPRVCGLPPRFCSRRDYCSKQV